ncbi:MAG TPA: amidase, partial [Trueperaceae bacterium]|nr:amidase [Trueperaceae bacterium]
MTEGPASVSTTARLVRGGSASAREVVEAALARAESAQANLNAFITIDPVGALAAADALDERRMRGEQLGPLAGVPVAVKDNIATAGVPNTAASEILQGYVPPFDATVVARLKAAGAIVIGKTNLDEFGMGSTGERSALGPTRNPHDTSRVAGGSSSGSATTTAGPWAPIWPCGSMCRHRSVAADALPMPPPRASTRPGLGSNLRRPSRPAPSTSPVA